MARITWRIASEEYDAIRQMVNDPDWPIAHDGWLERTSKEEAQRIAHGEALNPVQINAQEFADWCRRAGVNPSLYSLGAFAVAKAGGKA